ncbi:Ca-activated chloride channel family protein [Filimonas lacunae]|uniref:Ca-activated chloride channel family protein n=1 Tax=Filimonas lacunae TaxID=477680 RepID=A0A173MLR8_9BACT|nr:VWA domain-containing protein [Filimonas lacunae]BAV08582.1 Von Willebrand factor type A domain protein [Filimonas lacunae]SIS57688.1 Ca-activated chloride channel family protein [Filimonas lacunae]
MRKLLLVISLLFCLAIAGKAQYYLRGEIRDEKGNEISNVKTFLFSRGYIGFLSSSFGIPSRLSIDTITLIAEGYETLKSPVQTNKFQKLVMKMQQATARLTQQHLSSVTKNLKTNRQTIFPQEGESYTNLVENNFVSTLQAPETGFALHVDRAAYSNIRRFLTNDNPAPPDAVRIEEMLNYFNFTLPAVDEDDEEAPARGFTCATQLTTTPWNKENQLLFVNLKAPKLNLAGLPPSNLVFLIDVSGSMDKPNRLPLIQSAFKLLVENLRAIDTVSIVVYGGDIGVKLAPTSGADKQKINDAIDLLVPNGDTPGAGAIKLAYTKAEQSFNSKGNNRVIMATDGDFNVGETSEKALEDLITKEKMSGIYLTCLGVGMGNYKDSKLEMLAKRGNGNFAYLDNINEAEKVLITEFTKTLYAVASDAFVNITFNPKMVKEYRLIGFDNKLDALSDSTSELEGGEVGSGHSMVAVFEIVPQISNKTLTNNDTLIAGRYGSIKLHYKLPSEKKEKIVQQFTIPINYVPIEQADETIRFATSVAMFGELLKQSRFVKDYTWDNAKLLAQQAGKKKLSPLQTEYLGLLDKAKKIYAPAKKKKKNGSEED